MEDQVVQRLNAVLCEVRSQWESFCRDPGHYLIERSAWWTYEDPMLEYDELDPQEQSFERLATNNSVVELYVYDVNDSLHSADLLVGLVLESPEPVTSVGCVLVKFDDNCEVVYLPANVPTLVIPGAFVPLVSVAGATDIAVVQSRHWYSVKGVYATVCPDVYELLCNSTYSLCHGGDNVLTFGCVSQLQRDAGQGSNPCLLAF